MKIQAKSSILKDALGKLLTVIDKKNSRPILSNCLFKAENGRLEIIATDLEVAAKIIVESEISTPGEFCINTKNIFDIVKELPDSHVDLVLEGEKNILSLNCDSINYSLLVTNSEDYPQVNFSNSGKPFELSAKNLSSIISKTSHAISSDETRMNLNGIYMQQIESKLRSVAIDGHRMALVDIEGFESENTSLSEGVIVPKKAIAEIKKITDTYPDEKLTISLDESFLYLSSHDSYFLSVRLIAREYPKYQSVIPAKTTYTMSVEREKFQNAVRRVKILSNEKTNGIKLGLKPGSLSIMANHPSLGHALENIAIDYSGEEMELGLNAKYLLESLNVIEGDEVIYEFNNELSPIIIKSAQDQNFLGIIMPLKL